MVGKKIKEFLDSHKIKYAMINHATAYTAQEIAAAAHIPGKELAKTVMIKVDGKMAMAILPASYRIDLKLLKEGIGAQSVEMAREQDFQNMFPECETGAMPPFGCIYGMDDYVAEALAEDEEIAFNAGTHTDLIRMAYHDFESLVKPKVVKFSKRE